MKLYSPYIDIAKLLIKKKKKGVSKEYIFLKTGIPTPEIEEILEEFKSDGLIKNGHDSEIYQVTEEGLKVEPN